MRPFQHLATIIVRKEFEKFQATNRKQEVLANVVGEIDKHRLPYKKYLPGAKIFFSIQRN